MNRAILLCAVLALLGCDSGSTASRPNAGVMPGPVVPPPAPTMDTTLPPTTPMGAAGQGAPIGMDTQPVMTGDGLPPMDTTPPPPTDDGMMMDDMPMDGMDTPMDGMDTPMATGDPGTLQVEFTTVSYGGEYAPGNYGAVWIEDANGAFVKTAKRWAGAIHAGDLATWTAASGGWGFGLLGGGNTADMMDAISMATLRAHESHVVVWNLNGPDGQPVPDGSYVAVLEMTESRARDRNGPLLRIPFEKGATPQTLEVPDEESFQNVVVRFSP